MILKFFNNICRCISPETHTQLICKTQKTINKMKTIKTPLTGLARKLLAIPVVALLFAPLCSFAQTDNTAAVQKLLTAGDVTLPANTTYYVTGLSVTHALNMNGSTFIMTGASN